MIIGGGDNADEAMRFSLRSGKCRLHGPWQDGHNSGNLANWVPNARLHSWP